MWLKGVVIWPWEVVLIRTILLGTSKGSQCSNTWPLVLVIWTPTLVKRRGYLIKWRGPLVTFRTNDAILDFTRNWRGVLSVGYLNYLLQSFERSIQFNKKRSKGTWFDICTEHVAGKKYCFLLNLIECYFLWKLVCPAVTVIRLWLSLEVETSICFCIYCYSTMKRSFAALRYWQLKLVVFYWS